MLRRLAAGFLVLLGLAVAAPTGALALDLDTARAQGLVGERYDGLIGPVQGGGEVQALVARINSERMEEYRRIAEQRGVPVSAVQKLVGEKLVNNAAPGTFVMTPSGDWRKK
ncbi:hypothetical protein C882_4253 [Caenispirillum salinarum AK4]|uniref:DUF1318 domain-containing protein n=1 Tax=Caenispirillum salinarum AK4 TaxID=1238182 RepID=K9HR62_9PROT|nr:YdbL family protein [Caenispirillum salinarum]EKV30916.1 hypothetical protein C882_4253 [Caenispirillum salinarum AK4]